MTNTTYDITEINQALTMCQAVHEVQERFESWYIEYEEHSGGMWLLRLFIDRDHDNPVNTIRVRKSNSPASMVRAIMRGYGCKEPN